ncbi:MAG: DUF1311 domain-containing protein [Caryophanon sp.]|nr:DUF1311 domain-containing protein [Caryophanon sp.]
MKEWKMIGMMSLVVNVLLIALLWVSIIKVQEIVERKNQVVQQLETEVAQLTEQSPPPTETDAQTTAQQHENVAAEEERAVAQQAQQPSAETADVKEEQVVTEQPPQQQQPVQQPSYKEKLLSYKPSLHDDYEYVYFLYDGMPGEDTFYESMSNAEVKAMYEEIYEKTDAILNKVYGILKDTLPEEEFIALRTEQRAWLQRVTDSKEQRLAMGGSSAETDAFFNLGMETQQRCVELMMEYFAFEDYYGN